MRYPWANSLLFLFLGLELLTGLIGLVSGSQDRAVYLQLHRVGGYGILAVLVWKTANVVASWQRPRGGTVRLASLALTASLVVTLALGLAWSIAGPFGWWLFSGVSWHIYTGLAMLPLLLWHSWHMARRAPLGFWVDRRQFLRVGGLAAAGFVAWQVTEGIVQASGLNGRERRFTGSYEAGSFTGNDFPRVSWLDDDPDLIEAGSWRLEVHGASARRLSLIGSGLARGARATATLDCTGGWHSTQQWYGTWLADLLDEAGPDESARSIAVRSVTGYYRRFSLADAREFLLATHVGGEPLSHGHGAPLRLVAPGRRGFEWVKWVTEIEISGAPGWWQLPLPAQ